MKFTNLQNRCTSRRWIGATGPLCSEYVLYKESHYYCNEKVCPVFKDIRQKHQPTKKNNRVVAIKGEV